MGISSSSNVSRVVVNAVSKVSSEIIQTSTISQNSTQIISVKSTNGDVIIKGNRLTQRVNLNLKALLDALSTEVAQQNLATKLAQEAKALTSGLNIGQYSDASNTMDTLVNASISLMTKIGQTCAITSNQMQSITVESTVGSVRIENNVLEQVTQILSQCAENAVSNSSTIQDVSVKLDQASSATASGLSAWFLAAIAAVLIGVPVGGAVIGGTVLLKYLFPLLLVIGVVFIILYFYKTTVNMSITGYSTFIKNTNACLANAMPTTENFDTAELAANACLENANCKAFDWKGINVVGGDYSVLNPPTTTFYDKVSNCQKSIKPDTVKMVRAPVVYSGSGPPTGYPQGSIEGDVYVDTSTTLWYQWTKLGIFEPKGTILTNQFKEIKISAFEPTIDSGGYNGYYWIYANKINPEYWHVYQYDSNAVQKWIPQDKVQGPGMWAMSPKITNASGFKVTERKSWLLYSGIAGIVVGALGTAYVFFQSSKSKEKV